MNPTTINIEWKVPKCKCGLVTNLVQHSDGNTYAVCPQRRRWNAPFHSTPPQVYGNPPDVRHLVIFGYRVLDRSKFPYFLFLWIGVIFPYDALNDLQGAVWYAQIPAAIAHLAALFAMAQIAFDWQKLKYPKR